MSGVINAYNVVTNSKQISMVSQFHCGDVISI